MQTPFAPGPTPPPGSAFRDLTLTDEPGRIAALRRLEVLDTTPEEQFDKIVALVCAVLDVPTAAVSLIDERRQWFKARQGIAESEIPHAFCAHAIRQRDALVIEDATRDPRFANSAFVTGPAGIRAYAGVPLTTADGYNVGALCAIDTVPRSFTPAQIEVLAKFGHLVVDELELRQIASTDQLTGALTRRGFLAAVDRELACCRRDGQPAALVLLDIDHFKRINDGWGHPIGDAVLHELVARCARQLRPRDTIGRMGGEEFALLLPGSDASAALITAERIRNAIQTDSFADATGIAVTASFGIAPLTGQGVAEAWIAAADTPLYIAKRTGRNRCVMAAAPARKVA